MFDLLLTAVGIVAGAIAAIAGFGIGSLLTPVLSAAVGTELAVAAVSIPHLAGTAFRFWRLGVKPDRRVFRSFGLTSAAGGLAGALLHGRAGSPVLALVFGCLLLFTSASEWLGWSQRMRFTGPGAWIAGGVSGMFGGLVGNQGGIRSAALLGFDLERRCFVATATAIGLVVDAARMPLYFYQASHRLVGLASWLALATLGVLIGTLLGNRILVWIPERQFRRVVAVVLALLGLWMIRQA